MEFEEWLVVRNAEHERRESELFEMEEREIRYWAKFRAKPSRLDGSMPP